MNDENMKAKFAPSATDQTTLSRTTVTAGPIKMPESLKLFSDNPADPVTIVFGSDRLGEGDPALGRELLKSFLMALDDLPKPPQALILYNAAVQLVLADSPVLTILKSLQNKRTEILICQASLKHFSQGRQSVVGEIRTMNLLVERMMQAHHILWPK